MQNSFHRQSLGAVVDLWKYLVRSADECEPFVFVPFFPLTLRHDHHLTFFFWAAELIAVVQRIDDYLSIDVYKHSKITRNFFHSFFSDFFEGLLFFWWWLVCQSFSRLRFFFG